MLVLRLMKSIPYTVLPFLMLWSALFLSAVHVNAQGSGQAPGAGGCTAGQLCNPLKVGTIQEFLIAIIEILIQFAIPIIILFIMYAGFLFVTAKGDTGQIEKARAALTWAVVGGVIILAAQLIITVITGTVDALKQ